MIRLVTVASVVLCLAQPTWAASMPKLPDLPPLPTHYQSVGGAEGFYAGIFGGAGFSDGTTGVAAVAVGTTLSGADLLLGLEGMALLTGRGSTSFDASVRLGVPLGDSLALYGQLGLGANTDTGSFVSLGASLEWNVTDTVSLRTQYRLDRDLSGDPSAHLLLTGAVLHF